MGGRSFVITCGSFGPGLLCTTYCILAGSYSYLDCLPIPKALPSNFDIHNVAAQLNVERQMRNNTQNIGPFNLRLHLETKS